MIDWDVYAKYKISPSIHSDLRHTDITRQLQAFQDAHPQRLKLKELGTSVEGRSISLLTIGQGKTRVFAWTQMHGNEPTHTAALIDLLNFFLSEPKHPYSDSVLSACELSILLMLNPDGAERWTRRNAQDIDINRDALHVQTPEGRILRDTVLGLQPDFALNLHNHRPHTTVGQTRQPASFSLLVPPIDAEETNTPEVAKAKQIAGVMADAVAPHCPGPISRYDADFMPRCFGEWVQQQGAATITVEAGGWSTVDAEPLVQLHFYGLAACFNTIATGGYSDVSPSIYEHLPRTGEHDLFDKLIKGATVISGSQAPPLRTDIGINFRQTKPTECDGWIADLGDLHVTDGKQVTDASNLACLPGRIAFLPKVTPSLLPDESTLEMLLAEGITTAIGVIDLQADDADDLGTLKQSYTSPINLGFLANVSSSSPEVLDRLIRAISQGILGVIADEIPPEIKLYLSLFDFPIVLPGSLPQGTDVKPSLKDCASRTQQCAELLKLKGRDSIRLDNIADLLLVRACNEAVEHAMFAPNDLHRVIVGGNVVFEQGKRTDRLPGVLLSSPLGQT